MSEQRLQIRYDDDLATQLGRWYRFAGVDGGEWVELQTLGFKTTHGDRVRSAHADSLDAAVRLLEEAERYKAVGHYIIANRLNDAVASRRDPGRWHDAIKGSSTSDRDVIERRVIFIDVDARRPSGTSSTDTEMAAAVRVATQVYDRLASHFGTEECLAYAHSGNGRQIFVALEPISESEAVATIVRGLLTALSLHFSDDGASLDATVTDAKRLVPAFGTWKRKGAAGVASRPHRRTAIVCAEDVRRVPLSKAQELLEWLRAELSDAKQAELDRVLGVQRLAAPSSGGAFSKANAVPVEEVVTRLGLKDGDVLRCPGCGSTDGVALVGNGLKCHHQRCAGRGPPRTPGFRTPVDLVMEVRGVDAKEAAATLGRDFGLPAPLRLVRGGADVAPPTRRRVLLRSMEREVADEAITALVESGTDVFQRGNSLVRVAHDGDRSRVLTLAQPTLREMLSTCVEWVELRDKKGELVPVVTHAPRWAIEAIHARGEWEGVRPLQAVVEFPVLRPDGTLVTTAGYDEATRVLYVPNAEYGALPSEPSIDDARRAVAELAEVFVDFPFRGEANRSACVAALLTPFARYAFTGSIPSVLIDGNIPGAGKGLMANAINIIVTGRTLDVRCETPNEDEARKRILSIARTGDPVVLIDNVTRPLGGGALDAALTAQGTWSDRGLGTLDEVRTPLTCMWVFTGNNVEFQRKDTRRRMLHVRLAAQEERPENRQGFKHYPLLPWVKAHRTRLVRAAVTVLRAYVVAGRPQAPLAPWGSFEEWGELVRQAVVWAGLVDPYEARHGLEEGDPESAAVEGLLVGWEELCASARRSSAGCSASEALEMLRQDDLARFHTQEMRGHPPTFPRLREAIAELLPTPPGTLPSVHRLGNLLRRYRGRTVQGKALDCGLHCGTNVWRVVPVTTGVSAA